MATITVRGLDDSVRDELKALGEANGRSMESEVRAILTEAVRGRPEPPVYGFGTRIHERFKDLDFPELERDRTPARVVDFGS